MALDAFLDSNFLPMILSGNGAEGIFEALISNSSLRNEEHFDSMAQINPNSGSDVLNSIVLGRSSTSRFGIGHDAAIALANLSLPAGNHLQSHSSTSLEPYTGLPTPLSSYGSVDVSYNGGILSHSCQTRENESKRQKLDNAICSTDLCKAKGLNNGNSLPVRTEQELGSHVPIRKKPRIPDVNHGNIQQQQKQQQEENIHELVLKELQDYNPQLKAMMKQHRQQTQLQQQILHSTPHLRGFHLQIPKQQMQVLPHDQGNQQETFAPLLDGGICSRRLMQYLYHLRNKRHDNDISYWEKFVSEYYACGSKKKWCFSRYEHIELHTAGVFCPKSMETYCCQICGLKSGKGLEATSEIFPRLFKMKFDCGMLDEILYIDSPRACKVPNGLMLEYEKAIQESVYETFRVVHNGTLRVVFRHDLKILSWEFCIENHEEYLHRTLFTHQVNQLVQAVAKYQDIQTRAFSRASLLDLQKVCDMVESTGIQIAMNMELPLVNDLGYPKRFIRCLQIAEVVDSMKDLMAFSQDRTLGAIECLNNYSRGKNGSQTTGNQGIVLPIDDQNSPTSHEQPGYGLHANGCSMTENGAMSDSEISGLAIINSNPQFIRQNSSAAAAFMRRKGSSTMGNSNRTVASVQSPNSHFHKEVAHQRLQRSQSSECSQNSHQALVDKMLHEMLAASRGTNRRPSNEAAQKLNQTCATTKELRYIESPISATSTGTYAKVASHCSSQNSLEPCSPDLLSEAFQSAAACFSKLEGFGW